MKEANGSCRLVDYGNEEKRCLVCGYITWNSEKTDEEIVSDMIKAGYQPPKCKKDENYG